MDDQVLGLLRFGMLGLLYLFFGRAMWAVWSEVRATPMTPSAPTSSTPAPVRLDPSVPQRARTLVVVEPAAARRELTWSGDSFVIGRGRDCDLSLPDDAFLSQRHVGFTRDVTGLWVEDLGSTNGTLIDGRRIGRREPLFHGARIGAGSLVVEAR